MILPDPTLPGSAMERLLTSCAACMSDSSPEASVRIVTPGAVQTGFGVGVGVAVGVVVGVAVGVAVGVTVGVTVGVAVGVTVGVTVGVGVGGGVATQELNLKLPIRVRQVAPRMLLLAAMYSFVYQKVQSSVGSTVNAL